MFTKIKLANFRKHVDTTLDFQTGVNVIRGAVEQGKSTIMEAVAYALFGSRALLDTLELVVTYGQAVGTLKVALDFKINGGQYSITRGKSGAELFVNGKLTVTGQTEVTKFVEVLLGVNADTASKLMLANQASLRGALSDGPTAAAALIETLANFDIISAWVDLIQAKLLTGSTVAYETRIAQIAGELEAPLVDTTSEASAQEAAAARSAASAQTALETVNQQVAEAKPGCEQALAQEAAALQAEKALAATKVALERAVAATAISIPEAVDPAEVAALEQKITAASQLTAARAAKASLAALPDGDEWEGDADSLEASTAEAGRVLTLTKDTQTQATVALVRLRAQLITETHCAFCDKDLTQVPEVTARNSKLAPEIAACEKILADCKDQLPTLTAGLASLVAVRRRADTALAAYSKCAGFISLSTDYVPARYEWTGPDFSASAEPVATLNGQLAALKRQADDRSKAQGRLMQAQEQAKEAADAVQAAEGSLAASKALADAAAPTIEGYRVLDTEQAARTLELSTLRAAHATAQLKLEHAKTLYAAQLKARESLTTQLAEAKQAIAETNFNNALIKKLRTVRPQVADKLWSMVLATVSKYFTQIRGIPSKVTRTDKGFLVNGHFVGGGGLSGSALDSLGLAIRIALTKTFLPNTRFLILDEASSACNEEREANMAGCVAASDFDQVIWVTHSDAIEAFANHVIQL